MPDVPQTLEPTLPLRGVAATPSTSAVEHENELLELELKRNNILMQLLHEEDRLKKILRGGTDARADVTGKADLRPLGLGGGSK
jgi:hypothetical protein